jgi:hypothetical protein
MFELLNFYEMIIIISGIEILNFYTQHLKLLHNSYSNTINFFYLDNYAQFVLLLT